MESEESSVIRDSTLLGERLAAAVEEAGAVAAKAVSKRHSHRAPTSGLTLFLYSDIIACRVMRSNYSENFRVVNLNHVVDSKTVSSVKAL